MSEPRPLYLSVGTPTSLFETLEIRAHGDLIRISGPPVAFLAPREARAAILQLQAILDRVDPPQPEKTPFPAVLAPSAKGAPPCA